MQVVEKHHTDWKPARLRWSSATAPALLLAIFVCFFWKLLLTNQFTWLDNPDIANQVLPWYQFEAGEWHAGHLPLWDPYLWGGQPLLGQMQPGTAYPPNWLLFLAPLRNGWIRQAYLHWYFVLIHFQAALFCYWLLRDLKRSTAASLLAALAFGLGGFVGTNGWPAMLNGAVWAPLVLLFFLRAMRGERPISNIAWSGAFLGIAFLSGHHQVPIFITVTMGGLWLFYLSIEPSLRITRLKLFIIFSLFLILLSSFQTLPAAEYARASLRWVGAENPVGWSDKVPYSVHQQYSLRPESMLGIFIPGLSESSDPFVGLAALALALLGVVTAWNDRMTRLFAGIALGGMLYALGSNSVFHGVLYSLLPMVEKARNPSMATFILHLGLCCLIAYGVDYYEFLTSEIARRAASLLCVISAVLAVVIWGSTVIRTPVDTRLGVVMLAGLLVAATLMAWNKTRIPKQAAVISLGLVMLFELGNVTTYTYHLVNRPESLIKPLSQHADIAAFLRDQGRPVRIEVNENDIPYNFGDWYGIDHFGGYLASMTANVARVQGNLRAREMYGVNFQIGKAPSRPGQVEVFQGSSGIKVYSDPAPFPRAWAVHDAISIQRDDQINTEMDDPHFDPRRQTFVEGVAPRLVSCPDPETEAVALTQHLAESVTIEANLHCRGMVISSDTYYPGWVATVDQQPARIYEAYGFLRGVVVDAGRHRIELRYRPQSVYWGAALSLIGLLGACALTRVKWSL
jgi:hypothetical protein